MEQASQQKDEEFCVGAEKHTKEENALKSSA
jgi:hypothetical protein